jgi:hypothetical protein
LKPGSSLLSPSGPVYYSTEDLYIGGKIEVCSHHFVLLDADEYVFNYMESDPVKYKQSDKAAVFKKVAQFVASAGGSDFKRSLKSTFAEIDPSGSKSIDRLKAIDAARSLKLPLSDHELVTLLRIFEEPPRRVNYSKLLAALDEF